MSTKTSGQQPWVKRERSNSKDRYVVAVMKGSTVVGHLPRRISQICALFIRREGFICCAGHRQFTRDLP